MKLDEDTIIGDFLDRDESFAEVFLSQGLGCMGCPASRGETIGEACEIHGIAVGDLLGKLRSHMQKSEAPGTR